MAKPPRGMRLPLGKVPDVHLREYDRVEWYDILKQLKPELTQEEFDESWDELQEIKRKRELN